MLQMNQAPQRPQKTELDDNKSTKNFNLTRKSIQSNQLIQRYSPQAQFLCKCLPAKFHTHPIYGQLMIKFGQLIFLLNIPISKGKNVIYRCRMLGYNQQQLPFFSSNITYTIHTNNKMFKHYIKDMKVCLVEILDSRNYQPIGHCYINWLTHMKSIEDNQPIYEKDQKIGQYEQNISISKKYFLPFIDEECQMTLPIFDYRNPKVMPKSLSKDKTKEDEPQIQTIKSNPKQRIIGQVKIKFMSRIYEHPISKGYEPHPSQNPNQQIPTSDQQVQSNQKNENQVKYNNIQSGFLQVPLSKNAISKNMISLKSISPSNKVSEHHIKFEAFAQNNKRNYYPELQRKPSNLSAHQQKSPSNKIYKATHTNLFKQQSSHPQSRIYSQHYEQNHRINTRNSTQQQNMKTQKGFKSSSDLQSLQLKMDAQNFFKDNEFSNFRQKQERVILEIVKLKSKLSNITQLDIYLHQNQQQLSQDQKSYTNKPHLKTFKISSDKLKNQDYFKSKLIIEKPSHRIVQIQLPNGLGKCIFRCKDLTQTNNDVCVYSKGIIIGVISIKKQIESKPLIPIVKNNQTTQLMNKPLIKQQSKQDKICIVLVQNFIEHYSKKSQLLELANLDNYAIYIKNLCFFHETLLNSKSTGQYSVINSETIPKLFAIQVRNSSNQFVGMSANISFNGNQIPILDQNIMPTLVCQQNITINLKQMPVFKTLPYSISFRLSLFISNTNQLNYFIGKFKQNMNRNRTLESRKQKSLSNQKVLIPKQSEKIKQKQYTISDQVASENKNIQRRLKTESQNAGSVNRGQSKQLGVRQSQRFKTQGNYTDDFNNEGRRQNHQSEPKQLHQQISQQKQGPQQEEQQIYLVQFFCKSLHYVLSQLKSKKNIQKKLNELNNYQYTKRSSNESSFQKENSFNSQSSKGLVFKDQFNKIVSLLISDSKKNDQDVLGFDLKEILEALFIAQDGNMVKLQQFSLCLMAYYNFLLLLSNEKLFALKQVISCEPQAKNKLLKIQSSMTNINSQFLWDDILTNVIQNTKQKINKRYRIYPNTPFSVEILVKDLALVEKSLDDPYDESIFSDLLQILSVEDDKKYDNFVQTTADLGGLIRQTVEQIIFNQTVKSSRISEQPNWFTKSLQKMDEYIQREKKQNNLQSISSDPKTQFCFNLTQFQQFFSLIGIQTSIWESLLLIEEIKVWHQNDYIKDKSQLQTGEGVIAVKLIQSWFRTLRTKTEIKNSQKNYKKQILGKASRLNSVKSIDSDEQDIIEQINKRNKSPKQHNGGKVDQVQKEQNSPKNRIATQEIQEILRSQKIQKNRKNSQKNSMRQSQNINNESDIANIANLLRQNENNMFFLPSISDPNTMNKIMSGNNIISNENILKGLEQNSIRNAPSIRNKAISEGLRLDGLQKINSQRSEIKQSEQSQKEILNKREKKLLQPINAYLSIQLKQLKVKNKQHILSKQGLKKMTLSFKKYKQQPIEQHQPKIPATQNYFLSQQTIAKIFNQPTSSNILQKYKLKNFAVDINNLYEFETSYNQGISLKMLNLTQISDKQRKIKKGEICIEDKVQRNIFIGVLPAQDIAKVIEQYKEKFNQNNSNDIRHSKRKTIVLYTGKQLNGKAVVEIIVSNKEIKDEHQNPLHQYQNLTTIQLSFEKKALFNKKNKLQKQKQSGPTLIKLSYCSIRDNQKTIQLLPVVEQHQTYEINLPEPIIQYLLILQKIQIPVNKSQEQLLKPQNISGLSVSRFTKFQNQKQGKMQENILTKEQCTIPLENLYFKRTLLEEYPLINQQTGSFVCSLNVKLSIVGNQPEKIEQSIEDQKSVQNLSL